MTSNSSLRDFLEEWETLTEAEGKAIGLSLWSKVVQCQTRKKDLQSALSALGQQGRPQPPEIRDLVQRVIAMEATNLQLLEKHQEKLAASRSSLTASSRNLHRIRSAYSARRDSVWNSFS